jgi:hypothetical protein
MGYVLDTRWIAPFLAKNIRLRNTPFSLQPNTKDKPFVQKTLVMNNTPTLINQVGRRVVIPLDSPTLNAFSKRPVEELQQDLTPTVVDEILLEWRNHRGGPEQSPPSPLTAAKYRKVAARWEAKMGTKMEIPYPEGEPVQVAIRLLDHSSQCSFNTWMSLRSALMFMYYERLLSPWHEHNWEQLKKAVAILLCHRTAPSADQRPKSERRKKSMSQADQTKILEALVNRPPPPQHSAKARERAAIAQEAALFIQATIVTGARPGEWHEAELMPALQEHMPNSTSCQGWYLLRIKTEKRKVSDPLWIREQLLTGASFELVSRHLEAYRTGSAVKGVTYQPAHKHYAFRCTRIIGQVCKKLWPGNEEKRATLYTFRHQARANLTAIYGAEIAAVMMGHNYFIGVNNYAGKQRANLTAAMRQQMEDSPTIMPARSTLAQASANQNQRAEQQALKDGQATPTDGQVPGPGQG